MRLSQAFQGSWKKWNILLFFSLILAFIPARSTAAIVITRYVAPTGNDSGDCESASAPCRTIQHAVNESGNGARILVAAGTYTFDMDSFMDCGQGPNLSTFIQTNAVVCLLDKYVSILGGFTPSNWNTPNPVQNKTIIDGENSYRGVEVIGYQTTTAALDMEGITIQNARSFGPTYLNPYYPGAMGGGMLVLKAAVTLRDMIFQDNQAIGANTTAGDGGAADGAAIRIETSPLGTSSLIQRVTFDNNKSIGGIGPDRGGVAFGALFIYGSAVTVEDSTFTNNLAQGGNSTGNGISNLDGLQADALGGGIGVENGTVTLKRLTITGNQVKGGSANQLAGGAYGGGVFVEGTGSYTSYVYMSDSYIANNTATAGNAATGGNSAGGGINTTNTQVNMERLQIITNTSKGGSSTGTGKAGPGAGGGIYIFNTRTGVPRAIFTNLIIAENFADQGSGTQQLGNGGGGGMVVQGIDADIIHTTFAQNKLGTGLVLGCALLVEPWFLASGQLPAQVNMSYSIVADHTIGESRNAAIVVNSEGASMTFNKGLFAGNTRDTNINRMPITPGPISGIGTMQTSGTAGFVSPGAPNHNYHITAASAAVNQATGSTLADDIDNDARPFGTAPDLGADEYVTPDLIATPDSIVVMSDNSTQIRRVSKITAPVSFTNWTASTTASWLYLGPAGTSNLASGASGDELVIRIAPGKVNNGTYTTTITVSSPDANQATISVKLVKADSISTIFIPGIFK